MVFILITIGLQGLTPETLLARLRKHILMLTGNANFPTTNPTIAALTTFADDLKDTIDKIAAGDHSLIVHRDTLMVDGKELIRLLSYDIQYQSQGDKEKIASSGFDTRAPKSSPQLPEQVLQLRAKALGNKKVKLQWKRVLKSHLYVIASTDNPLTGNWTLVNKTTRCSIVLEDLNPGQMYYFRVFAINSMGEGNPSDIVEQRVI